MSATRENTASGEQKRRRILDAAFEVSQERGVHAARMEEVAARAQVSKGTLYRFFESKEDLFLEMIIDSYTLASRAREALEASTPAAGPAEILHHRLEGLARVLDVIAPRARVHYQAFGVVGDSKDAMERVVQFLTEFHDARYDQYEEFVRAGQIEGVFRPDVDPGTLAHMIDALISGFIYRASFNPRSATPEALLACFELVFQRILGFEYQTRPSNEEDDG